MASARHRRSDSTRDDIFEIDLAQAIQRLLPAGVVEPGDEWFFSVDGATLRITRARHTSTPVED